jgi:hypothetical protein
MGYTGPDPAAVRAIHRHENGYITLANKKGDQYRDLCAITANQAQQLLPLFIDELKEDSYFSVHGMARAGKKSVTLAGIEQLAWSIRNSKDADFLTSAFIDCDCYSVGLTAGQALVRLIDSEHTGTLPPVSLYSLSGRGVWAFWLLDDGAGRVPKTGGRERRIWAGIERELCSRVKALNIGLDEGCIDLARVCRLPGSINSKADDGFGDEVRFLWQTNENSEIPIYEIDALADLLGVRSWIPRIYTGNKGQTGKRVGWQALWQKRLDKLDALQMLRGGRWDEGHRNNALFLLALCLRKTGNPDHTIRETIETIGIDSGLSVGESVGLVRKIERLDKYQKFSDEKMRAWLGITDKEADAIGWPKIQSDYWKMPERLERSANKAERIATRREFVAEYVRTVGAGYWTTRSLQAWLKTEKGFHAAQKTLIADLAALGIASPAMKERIESAMISLFA